MSRTLFWYIFKDLLRIFFMASGAIAGIMSFGGLLRPLTEHGLNIGQVLRMLSYFMPAMTAYSLPIAALFATTMVYGRLSADNEIVACRSAGISHLSMALPALVLGLTVAIFSLLLLCFIVPAFMLKAEKVVFSNVAQLVANEIERSHQIKLDQGGEPMTVFAQKATVLPLDPNFPREQSLLLEGPMFISYEKTADRTGNAVRIPEAFFIAGLATSYIRQDESTDELQFRTILESGRKFPRIPRGTEGGVDAITISASYPSLVRENPKFMDVWRLKELLNDESSSRRVSTVLAHFVEIEQKETFLRSIASQLTTESGEARIVGEKDTYVISRGRNAAAVVQNNKLVIGPTSVDSIRPVHIRQERDGQLLRRFDAQRIEIDPTPDTDAARILVGVELHDEIERIGVDEVSRSSMHFEFGTPMSEAIHNLPAEHKAAYYIHNTKIDPGQQRTLARERLFVSNTVQSELHGRVSFAVSCLILVMVGCALGMMFRSGNFLSAFALSVVPALMCIALIITGQHTCENVPRDVTHFHNSLKLGLGLIWSGNVAVAVAATVLLGRLQGQ